MMKHIRQVTDVGKRENVTLVSEKSCHITNPKCSGLLRDEEYFSAGEREPAKSASEN